MGQIEVEIAAAPLAAGPAPEARAPMGVSSTHRAELEPHLAVGGQGRVEEALRRGLDIAVAALALLLSLPLMLVLALLVRLSSPGPAIFRQERLTRGGRRFVLYKFRGMYLDAHQRWPELYEYAYDLEDLDQLYFHPEDDPRVTSVGRWLRRLSLDELPNFWNVLKGDLSLVGPRPEIPEMMPYYGPWADTILSVRPGITSLAKASGRDELTFSQTLELDLEYLRRRSLTLDVKILLATAATVVLQHGVLPG